VSREQIDCECGHTSTGETRPDVEITHLTHYLNDHEDLEEWQEEAAKDQLEWAREQASESDTKSAPGEEP
jgi:trimethylamine:corrinoid methyltransferase-like protein